jgi:hypothetical protein
VVRKGRIERVERDLFLIHTAGPSPVRVRLLLKNQQIAAMSVDLDEGSPDEELQFVIDEQELVILDWSRVDAWIAEKGEGGMPWSAEYTAWLLRDGEGDGARIESPILPQLSGRGSGVEKVILLTPDVTGVAFGFTEYESQARSLGILLHRLRVGPAQSVPLTEADDDGRLHVPPPTAEQDRSTPVRIVLTRRGRRLLHGGVLIEVKRSYLGGAAPGDPVSSCLTMTDSDGFARARLFPGRYVMYVDSSLVESSDPVAERPSFVVRGGERDLAVELEVAEYR